VGRVTADDLTHTGPGTDPVAEHGTVGGDGDGTAGAARVVVDFLADAGVRLFFTVPGESFLELMDEVQRRPGLELVSCRHESGAAFMAEAVGKLTGRPAVAMATRAVGAANLAIGVHTARQDSTPMLVLLGQVETHRLGREAFQEVDLPRFYSEITVHAETVHRADRAGEAVARAYRLATSGRPGPAMLAFPADVLAGGCPPAPRVPPPPVPTGPSEKVARALARLLRGARRPVAIVGRGGQADPGPVLRLAERFGLGVHTAFRRQDAFPGRHPQHLGHLGLGTPRELLDPLRDADVVLVLGCRLSEVTSQSYELPVAGAHVVQVDPHPDTLGATVPVTTAVPCAVGPFADALIAADDGDGAVGGVGAGRNVVRDWSRAHGVWVRLGTPPEHATAAAGVHPAAVLAAMRRHLPADAVLANDAGNFAAFCHRYWSFDHPHSQLGPTSGAMGYAVPAAVGAALAQPHRRVVAVAGDGGFLMTGVELETAVRHGAPVLVVVFQNRLYGTIALHQARATGRPAAVDIGDVDLAGMARSLGAEAVTVREPDELDDAFATAAAFDRPRVVVVRTDPDVLTPSDTLATLPGAHDRVTRQ
jgi:acetolactate synthase I/II/III large subunit